MTETAPRIRTDNPADLWRALAAAAAAQVEAIQVGDADGLDALLREKETLLTALSRRDAAQDAAADASLPGLMAAAQASEEAAEAALVAAREQARAELTALRARRTAQQAFRPDTPTATPAPRFCDRQS